MDVDQLFSLAKHGDYRSFAANLQDCQINEPDDLGNTLLHYSSLCGSNEIVDLLISKGANVNAKNFFNETPIFKALSRNHLEIVKKLLENGADLTIQTRSGETPLQFASSKEAYYLMNSHISKKELELVAPDDE